MKNFSFILQLGRFKNKSHVLAKRITMRSNVRRGVFSGCSIDFVTKLKQKLQDVHHLWEAVTDQTDHKIPTLIF